MAIGRPHFVVFGGFVGCVVGVTVFWVDFCVGGE